MSENLVKANETKPLVIQEVDRKQLAKFLDLFGAKDIPQEEKEKFIEICIINQLNPFKREAYITSYGQGDRKQFSFITGYEVYIKRAELSGRLDGWFVETKGSVKNNDLKAIITINRKDFSKPFIHEVWYFEYVQKTREGVPTKFWNEKPVTMIKKVAMAQGFRLCFNEILGGLPYTSDELFETEILEPQIIEHIEIKPEPPKQIKPKEKIICTDEIMQKMLNTTDLSKFAKLGEKYETTPEQLEKIKQHMGILNRLQSKIKEEIESINIPEWESEVLKEYAKEIYIQLVNN